MKVIDTREAMLKVIREVGFGSKTYEQYVEELCDRLMEAGAFVPPVNIGGVVYAALPSIFGEEAEISPWEVKGYGVQSDGEIYLEDRDHEQYLVGDMYCKLTLEEAEEWLRKERENGRKDS